MYNFDPENDSCCVHSSIHEKIDYSSIFPEGKSEEESLKEKGRRSEVEIKKLEVEKMPSQQRFEFPNVIDEENEDLDEEGDESESESSSTSEDNLKTNYRELAPEHHEAWRVSFYKRAFPVKKYEEGYPDAAKKVYMEKRRPLWLPQYGIDNDYMLQASYFSEILAKDQLQRQAVFDRIYKPNFGEYAYCRSNLIGKTYISKYMKGAHCCKFSPDGQYLVIGCGNGTIQVRDMETEATSVHCIRGYHRKITAIRFFPVGSKDYKTFFASSLTGRVYIGKREGKHWKLYSYLKEIRNEINAMDLNLNGSRMVTAGRDSHVRIYDTRRKKLVQMYLRPGTLTDEQKGTLSAIPDEGHFRRICAIKCDPDNINVFVTGGWDDIIKVWDMRVLAPVQSIAGPHLTSNSIDLWGRVLLTGQWTCNESIQLWDMRCCKCIHVVQPLNRPLCFAGEFINDVQFVHSWDGSPIQIPGMIGDLILAAGSGTKALEVISIKENMILHSTEEVNAVVSVDHFRSLIAYGSVNHLYGIVSFFPFVGTLSTEMKFQDTETENATKKRFSSYGNPMGWHEIAIDIDFMKAFEKSNENINDDVEKEYTDMPKVIIEDNVEEQSKKNAPETYSIKIPRKF